MKDIYAGIIGKIRSLFGTEADRSVILNSRSLQRKQCLLVFDGLKENTDLHDEFLAFLVELYSQTRALKMIVMVEHPQNLNSRIVENNFQVV